MDNCQSVRRFYSEDGIFLCACTGRGKGSCEIDVHNILFRPASEKSINKLEQKIHKKLTPSHRQFLFLSNGGIFFTQKTIELGWISGPLRFAIGLIRPLDKRRLEYECGFQLYSTSEIPRGHKEVVRWLKEMIEDEDSYLFDESEQEEKEPCVKWLDNILVIGEELNSGNYIAIDYNRKAKDSEHPIIFIDHEVPFSCSDIEADDPIISWTVDELLLKAAEDPAHFLMEVLGACATYSDGQTDQQWYPASYKRVHKDDTEYRGTIQWDKNIKSQIEEGKPTQEPEALITRTINMYAWLILRNDKSDISSSDKPYSDDMIDDYTNGIYDEIKLKSLSSPDKIERIRILLAKLNEALKSETRNYVRMCAILDSINGLCSMPTGCQSWVSLNGLRDSLRESIIGHIMDEQEFTDRLTEAKSLLLSAE